MQTLGDTEGQGSLAGCSSWSHKRKVGHNSATKQQQQIIFYRSLEKNIVQQNSYNVLKDGIPISLACGELV